MTTTKTQMLPRSSAWHRTAVPTGGQPSLGWGLVHKTQKDSAIKIQAVDALTEALKPSLSPKANFALRCSTITMMPLRSAHCVFTRGFIGSAAR